MVITGHLHSKGILRNAVDGDRRIEKQRHAQEVDQHSRLAPVAGCKPQRGIHDPSGNCSAEDVRPAAPPTGAGVVGHVADDRIGNAVPQARKHHHNADQYRVEFQADIQEELSQPSNGIDCKYRHQGANPETDFLRKRDAILERRNMMFMMMHYVVGSFVMIRIALTRREKSLLRKSAC